MWTVSLQPKNRYGLVSESLTQFGVILGRHKYAVIICAAILISAAAVALFQSSVVGTKNDKPATANIQSQSAGSAGENMHESMPISNSITTQSNVNAESNSSNNSQSTNTKLFVNGQNIAIPNNGSKHSTITSEDGNTNVDISINSSSKGTSSEHSSTYMSINATTSSEDVMEQNSP